MTRPSIAVIVALLALGAWPAAACDEECAPAFVFDDTLGTCVRVTTS